MENEMLTLPSNPTSSPPVLFDTDKIAETERWSRVAQRYVDIIMTLKRWRLRAKNR